MLRWSYMSYNGNIFLQFCASVYWNEFAYNAWLRQWFLFMLHIVSDSDFWHESAADLDDRYVDLDITRCEVSWKTNIERLKIRVSIANTGFLDDFSIATCFVKNGIPHCIIALMHHWTQVFTFRRSAMARDEQIPLVSFTGSTAVSSLILLICRSCFLLEFRAWHLSVII